MKIQFNQETEDIIMTSKQIYCMGRAEYLAEYE